MTRTPAAAWAALALVSSLACGIKAPPRPPSPGKPADSSAPAQPAADPPAQAKDCPGCPPPEAEKPAPQEGP